MPLTPDVPDEPAGPGAPAKFTSQVEYVPVPVLELEFTVIDPVPGLYDETAASNLFPEVGFAMITV